MNPGNQSNFEGDLVNWGLSATDAAGHAIVYGATNLPAGLTISPAGGIVSGKVYDGDSADGPYNVTVTATDSVNPADYASQTFRWTVHPIVTLANPGPQSNAAGDTVSLPLHATDAAGNALQYNFTLGGTLPPGLTLNQSTGLISGTLTSMAPYGSPYTPTVIATDAIDSLATASQTFTWTVGSNGGASVTVTNPGSQDNNEGDTINWTVSATDSARNALLYSATGLPDGLSIDGSTGTISGTIAPYSSHAGPYSVTVTARDSVNTAIGASQTFQWAIHPAVTLGNPGTQANADGDTVDLQLAARNSASNALTYSATNLPSGLSISGNGLIQGTIASGADLNSPYSVTVSASDTVDSAASASQVFSWGVSTSNTVTVTIGNPGDQNDSAGDDIGLSVRATDSQGNAVVFGASGLPPGLSISPTTGSITGTIASQAWLQSPYTVVLMANDSRNPDIGASTTLQWTVHPRVALPGSTALSNNEGDTILVNMGATDSAGNPLSYSATGLPSGLTIDADTGIISGIIASGASANSPYSAMVTATDTSDGAGTASTTISWSVSSGGETTVTLANPGNQTNEEGDDVALGLSATDSAGHALIYSANNLPPGLQIDPSTGKISGIVQTGASAGSSYPVTVIAADSQNSAIAASQSFQWTIHPGVTLSNPGDQTNAVADTIYLALQGTDSAGNPLNYGAVGLPPGLAFNPIAGVISGTVAPGADANSPYAVTLAATDIKDSAASAAVSLNWTVAASGTVTVSLANPGAQTNVYGDNVSVALSATDSADNPMKFTASGLPSGLSINSSTGLISGTVAQSASPGTLYSATVVVTDSHNTNIAATTTIEWLVVAQNLDDIDLLSYFATYQSWANQAEAEIARDESIIEAQEQIISNLNSRGADPRLSTVHTQLQAAVNANQDAAFTTAKTTYDDQIYSVASSAAAVIRFAISDIQLICQTLLDWVEGFDLPSEYQDAFDEAVIAIAQNAYSSAIDPADGFLYDWTSAELAFWNSLPTDGRSSTISSGIQSDRIGVGNDAQNCYVYGWYDAYWSQTFGA